VGKPWAQGASREKNKTDHPNKNNYFTKKQSEKAVFLKKLTFVRSVK